MIIRGGGAMGAAGFGGAAACICVRFDGGCAVGGTLAAGAIGGIARGGIAIAGVAGLALIGDVPAAGVVAAGGVTGTFGGMTTTVGGRYVAATEAGVTILGAGGGTTLAGFGGIAFVNPGASALASTVGAGAGGRTTGRAAGVSAASFCCVMARSTSPGREICERSILVLMPSSPGAGREALVELGAASERPRRCFRTRSAS